MKAQIVCGDSIQVLKTLPDNSIDSVITDPPYGLSNHSVEEVQACLRAWIAGEEYQPRKGKSGFMGKNWDAWVPGPEIWKECLRVLKPGGHMLVFAGTRSMDLMSMAIRLAGFELRDTIGNLHDTGASPYFLWCYGSGFPKSMNVSKAIQAQQTVGSCSMSDQRKSIMGEEYTPSPVVGCTGNGTERAMSCPRSSPPPVSVEFTKAAKQWSGWGTALKPAFEPILLCRKPLEGTVAQNVLQYGTGALNIDGCRVSTNETITNHSRSAEASISKGKYGDSKAQETHQTEGQQLGRWPANLVLSYPEDQYELREDITEEQRSELYAWLAAHAGETHDDQ